MNENTESLSWDELLETYTELRSERDALGKECRKLYPHGFTGNGVPGDYESLEMDFADADRDLHEWLASEEGLAFKRMRTELGKQGEWV